jgi:hypothetical protein
MDYKNGSEVIELLEKGFENQDFEWIKYQRINHILLNNYMSR